MTIGLLDLEESLQGAFAIHCVCKPKTLNRDAKTSSHQHAGQTALEIGFLIALDADLEENP